MANDEKKKDEVSASGPCKPGDEEQRTLEYWTDEQTQNAVPIQLPTPEKENSAVKPKEGNCSQGGESPHAGCP